LLLIHQGVEISKASRPRILAAAWARNDHLLTNYLLQQDEMFALPQVLGALNLLGNFFKNNIEAKLIINYYVDSGRRLRAIDKKITRLEKQGTAKAKRIGQLKSTINDLKRESQIGSVSGALAKHIRKWVGTVAADKLEFYALNMPKGPWTELADIIHFNPNDFQCKLFSIFILLK
jgi:hypothetical protein